MSLLSIKPPDYFIGKTPSYDNYILTNIRGYDEKNSIFEQTGVGMEKCYETIYYELMTLINDITNKKSITDLLKGINKFHIDDKKTKLIELRKHLNSYFDRTLEIKKLNAYLKSLHEEFVGAKNAKNLIKTLGKLLHPDINTDIPINYFICKDYNNQFLLSNLDNDTLKRFLTLFDPPIELMINDENKTPFHKLAKNTDKLNSKLERIDTIFVHYATNHKNELKNVMNKVDIYHKTALDYMLDSYKGNDIAMKFHEFGFRCNFYCLIDKKNDKKFCYVGVGNGNLYEINTDLIRLNFSKKPTKDEVNTLYNKLKQHLTKTNNKYGYNVLHKLAFLVNNKEALKLFKTVIENDNEAGLKILSKQKTIIDIKLSTKKKEKYDKEKDEMDENKKNIINEIRQFKTNILQKIVNESININVFLNGYLYKNTIEYQLHKYDRKKINYDEQGTKNAPGKLKDLYEKMLTIRKPISKRIFINVIKNESRGVKHRPTDDELQEKDVIGNRYKFVVKDNDQQFKKKSSDTKPSDTKSSDTKPSDTKPSDTNAIKIEMDEDNDNNVKSEYMFWYKPKPKNPKNTSNKDEIMKKMEKRKNTIEKMYYYYIILCLINDEECNIPKCIFDVMKEKIVDYKKWQIGDRVKQIDNHDEGKDNEGIIVNVKSNQYYMLTDDPQKIKYINQQINYEKQVPEIPQILQYDELKIKIEITDKNDGTYNIKINKLKDPGDPVLPDTINKYVTEFENKSPYHIACIGDNENYKKIFNTTGEEQKAIDRINEKHIREIEYKLFESIKGTDVKVELVQFREIFF